MTTTMPEAHVAVGKNRQKVYPGGKLFMRSGQEFSIELFNPTQDVVSAKIYLNDKAISDRVLVLKPGERAFLERYIDSTNKFKFETYEVENTTVAKQAVANNGKVRVEFFREKQPQITYTNTYIPYPVYYPTYPTYPSPVIPWNPYNPNIFYCGSSGTSSGLSGSCTTASNNAASSYTSSNLDVLNESTVKGVRDLTGPSGVRTDSVETGRVGAGGYSDQSFGTYTGEFESYYFASTEYQIMPESQKPVEINQIRMYCPGCRTRIRKSSWHFCPACGETLS